MADRQYDAQMDAPPPPLPPGAGVNVSPPDVYGNQFVEKPPSQLQPQPEPVVTQQPKPQPNKNTPQMEHGDIELAQLRHDWADVRNYFDSIDIESVGTWDYLEVAERFLRPINMPRLKQIFVEHKINGKTLFGLDKRDLRQMKIMAVGDRVIILNSVAYLCKLKERFDKNRKVWEGVVPYGSVAYYDHFFHMMSHKCCPCCNNTDKYKITATSVRVREDPPTCNLKCEGIKHNNSDLRFLKDVDWQNEIYCWCCSKNVLFLTFEIDDSDDPYVMKIAHPEIGDDLVHTIQDLWAAQRLVAD
eukprot:m.259049 g.259049  ORF g.259049 m.259049 type:complete len:301 (-) comp37475_c0_seq1:74-976(-)